MKEKFLITNFGKKVWKKLKPSLSEKFNARERIRLSENDKTAKTEKQLRFLTIILVIL